MPRDVILPIDRVDVRLDPAPHPFEVANAAEIDENWIGEQAANPAVFDGRMVLLSSLSHRDRRIEGTCHTIRFATFLHWRKHRDYSIAEHAYAHAALVTTDNALVAIRMGPKTSNPGQVYFAAGSFEPSDFRDGLVDLHFNMMREVREETGLDIDSLRRDPHSHALLEKGGAVIFRRYFLTDDAETAAAKIRDFVIGDPDPEIEEPVIIRHAGDLPDKIKPHMVPIINWHFANPAS